MSVTLYPYGRAERYWTHSAVILSPELFDVNSNTVKEYKKKNYLRLKPTVAGLCARYSCSCICQAPENGERLGSQIKTKER